jgi:hypothetical protein
VYLLKVGFAFISVGGATYSLIKLNELPGWFRAVAIMMAVAALVVAIPELPRVIEALQETGSKIQEIFFAHPDVRNPAPTPSVPSPSSSPPTPLPPPVVNSSRTFEIRSQKAFSTQIQAQAVLQTNIDGFVRVEIPTGAIYRNPSWSGMIFLRGLNIGFCSVGPQGWGPPTWVPLLDNLHRLVDANNWVSLNGLVATLQLPSTDPTLSSHWICLQGVVLGNDGKVAYIYGHAANAPFNFN